MLKLRFRHNHLCIFTLALLTSTMFLDATGSAQPPSLSRIAPTGAVPGESVDLTLHGGNLTAATRVWTSFSEETPVPEKGDDHPEDASKLAIRLSIPSDAPLGIAGVRVATDKGVSELRLFVIDDLPNILEIEPNNVPKHPQDISLPTAVSGVIEAEQYDYFRFSAQKGQTLSFEIMARRLGSPMDPLVRLLDSQGRELAYNDDGMGIGSDSRFMYSFDQTGDYLIEVRDIRFQGSENHFYRLRIGDFPIATAPYPMGGRRGSEIEVQLAGPQASSIERRTVKIPQAAGLDRMSIQAKTNKGQSSSFVNFEIHDTLEALEAEPNNLADQATPVPLPVSLNGRLHRPGDQDVWKFLVRKGDRFVFEGLTRRLGSPTDLYMILQKADGTQLATADDSGKTDGVINHTFADDGEHRLLIEDLNRRGGPEHVYRIRVRPYQPAFQLTANVQKVDIPQGGVATVTVIAQRQDYNGPIALTTEGLPSGIVASVSEIGAGQKQAYLTLTASAEAAAGQLILCKVIGTASVNGQPMTASVNLTDLLRGALANTPWPPTPLTRHVAAGVGPKLFFSLRTESPGITVGRNTTSKVVVQIQRSEDFKEAVALKVEGLPDKVTAELKPIEGDQSSGEITIKAAADAPLGTFSLLVSGTGKHKDKEISQPAPALRLETHTAFELKTDIAPEPLIRGASLEFKVIAKRFGDFTGAIHIEIKNLPDGVIPANTNPVIEEGKNEVAIQLKAADDAVTGAAEKVAVTGKAKVNDADQEVSSSPLSVVVEEKK